MKVNTTQDSLIDVDIRVFRDTEKQTKRLQIYLTIWSRFQDIKIDDFLEKDLQNKTANKGEIDELGILELNINVSGIPKPTSKPVAISKCIELENGKNANFIFDEDKNFIFLANVILPIKPEGTKRRVITYEDADIIDDTD